MSKMDKDPSFWAVILVALKENGLAMALTFLLTWLRIQFDDREPRPLRQLIEASLGSLIVMVVGLSMKEFGLSSAWSFAAAGFIGVLGVEQIRQLGRRWAERKADSL